jgi:O-antigen/teichoic acid export membrane protein
VGLFFLFGLKLLGSVLAILVGVLSSAVVAFHLLKTLVASIPEGGQAEFEPRTWLFYSVPLLFQSMAILLLPGIPLLMIEYLKDFSQAGVFSAALKVATLISLPLVGLNTVFAPRVSEVHGGGEVEKLGFWYRTMTAWTISVSLPLFLFILLFATPIMRIFGPEFTAGANALRLLATGHFVSAACGSAGCVLVMTGRVNISLANALLSTLLSVLLNLFLVSALGIRGAAIASAAVLAAVGILGLIEVFCLLRIQPYGRGSLKPMVSGGIAVIGLLLLSGQGVKALQVLLFAPAYLGLFWFLSSTDERSWVRKRLTAVIQGTTQLLRFG